MFSGPASLRCVIPVTHAPHVPWQFAHSVPSVAVIVELHARVQRDDP
jgi:hypothetical protein